MLSWEEVYFVVGTSILGHGNQYTGTWEPVCWASCWSREPVYWDMGTSILGHGHQYTRSWAPVYCVMGPSILGHGNQNYVMGPSILTGSWEPIYWGQLMPTNNLCASSGPVAQFSKYLGYVTSTIWIMTGGLPLNKATVSTKYIL